MGKIKNRRQKFHAAAVKLNAAEKKKAETMETNDESQEKKAEATKQEVFKKPLTVPKSSQDNPFAGLNIDFSNVKKDLPDIDARSTITSKSLKGNTMTKKEKRKLKKDFFIQKIDAIQAAKKEAKNKKKPKKHPVVGNMQVLADSLPTLELLLKDCEKQKEQREKNQNRVSKKSIPKMKARQKKMMNDVSVFKQVLKHPAYKKDAKSTMKEHLENWIQLQDEDKDKDKKGK